MKRTGGAQAHKSLIILSNALSISANTWLMYLQYSLTMCANRYRRMLKSYGIRWNVFAAGPHRRHPKQTTKAAPTQMNCSHQMNNLKRWHFFKSQQNTGRRQYCWERERYILWCVAKQWIHFLRNSSPALSKSHIQFSGVLLRIDTHAHKIPFFWYFRWIEEKSATLYFAFFPIASSNEVYTSSDS